MSDKLNEQADKMREMAQTTLDKAKDAVSKYMAESQKIREKADSVVQPIRAPRNERQGSRFRRSKCSRGLRARATAAAGKRPARNGAVYQNHLKEQMEKMNAQFRELGN